MNATLAEMDNMVVFEGYTRGELKSTFDLVCDKDNWKMPIDTIVQAANLGLVCIAIAFFVGDYPEIERDEGSYYRVRSDGYYNLIGA